MKRERTSNKPPISDTGADRPSFDHDPATLLVRAVGAVPAMKYAVAVAGLAATVALAAALHLRYPVVMIGSLFVVALMYVILSYSRFATRRGAGSDLLNLTVAWIFCGLVVLSGVLSTTALCFGWPRTLYSFLRASGRVDYWKIKVFDFADYGHGAEESRVGKRFSAMVLDAIMKRQIDVITTMGHDPISIVPQRGPAYEAASVPAYTELQPAIVVSGYVGDRERRNEYFYSIRVTAASESALRPVFQKEGSFSTNTGAMEANAALVANEVIRVAREFGSR